MAEGLSLREFGRRFDVTGEAVRKAIADGKIPADCVGERIVGKGKAWPVITDPDRAAEHWGKNRNPNQVRDKAVLTAGAKRGWVQRRGAEGPDDEPDDDAPAAAGAGGKGPSINDYKRITEAYKARMARLDYEERAGKLVNADQVKIGFVNMVTAARNKLLGVPSKAKAKIPHLTVRDIEILEDLIAKALEEVAADG
jgi:phage terminase Nu1 subunit (DNA packaging protein)